MHTTVIDTQEAPNKWFAAMDRQRRNSNNKSHYTAAQQTRAERLRVALQTIYNGKVYEPSYGVRGISVKVAKGALLRDRKWLRALEEDWTAEGIVKKDSPQGDLYYIKKI